MSYVELARKSRDFAAYLQGLPGMAKGERVAIMSPNLLQYPVALFGVLRAGMTVVNVNPMYTPRELEHQLKDSGARAIVILENFAGTLQKVLPNTPIEHVITTEVGDLLPAPKRWLVNFVIKRVKHMVPDWHIDRRHSVPGCARPRCRRAIHRRLPIAHADIAFLQYTGGTTGVAKGAMLTHRNILANLEQTGIWVSGQFVAGRRDCRRAAAAVPHLLPDLDAVVHEVGQPRRAHHQSARPAGLRQGAAQVEMDRDDRCQHVVQRPAQHTGIQRARLFVGEGGGGRRRGGAKSGRVALEGHHRRLHHRSVRAYRILAGRERQPASTTVERHDRIAVSVDRRLDPRRRVQRAARVDRHRRHRAAARARSASPARR